jgi:cold shock protein
LAADEVPKPLPYNKNPTVCTSLMHTGLRHLGWGVLDSDETPGGCWVHFSALRMPGYGTLSAGGRVHFEWEAVEQDGYSYRAEIAWPDGVDPTDHPMVPIIDSTAYRSTLTITWDDRDREPYQEDG